MRVQHLLKEHFQTAIGWHKKGFPSDIPGVSVTMGGVFSLMPTERLRFVTVAAATSKFDRCRFERIIRQQMASGWKPFAWKEDGAKDPSGRFRLYPFVQKSFGITSWLKETLGVDFSGKIGIHNMVKVAKYFTQPVDFSRNCAARVLVLPKEMLFADGCGYSSFRLFQETGDVVKVVGLGNGVVFKGTMLQGPGSMSRVPAGVLDEVRKRGLKFDVIATTDTVKFSKPWTTYEIMFFWHGDSSRNIHEKVTLSEQFIRVAPLTSEFRDKFMGILENRHETIREAFADRGRKLGNFVKNAALDQDFIPNDSSSNAIIGDVGNLLSVGVPYAFKRIYGNLMKGLQSFIRNRTIGCVKIPGAFGFVIADQTMDRGCIRVPSLMKRKKFGVGVGSVVTVWRSPISPTSVRCYRVVGFLGDNHVEMRSEDLNEYHQGDVDGDSVAVVPGALIDLADERSRLDDPIINQWSERFSEIKAEFTRQMPAKDVVDEIINEIEVVTASKGVGSAERARAAIEVKHGRTAWRIAYAFFQAVEQALIDMKKHSGTVWDANEMIDSLIGREIPVRPGFHRLLGNRANSSNSMSKFLRNPGFSGCNHGFMAAYRKGVEMARDVIKGFVLTDEDRKELGRFKTKVKSWLNSFIDGSNDRDFIRKNVVSSNGRPAGALYKMWTTMAAFYWKVQNEPNATELRREFRELELTKFASAKGDIRKAIIGTILINEIYGWVFHFGMEDLKAVIDEATAPDEGPGDKPLDSSPESVKLGGETMKTLNVFTDGSYTTKNPTVVGWGFVAKWVGDDGYVYTHSDHGVITEPPGLVAMRQIGGELKAVVEAIKHAIAGKFGRVVVHHDYTGVACWVNGSWKCKNEWTRKYAAWVRAMMAEIEIVFEKISGDDNPADEEARKGTGAQDCHG